MRLPIKALVSLLVLGLLASPARADEHVRLTLKNHRFSPAEITVAAGKPISIEVINLDASAAEFESKTLRVEEVIGGNGRATVAVNALAPGRYRFFDDYNEDTTEGFLTAR